MPTPPGPYPSKVTSSYCSPSSWPVPRITARSLLSFGMFSFFAARIAVRRRGLEFGSPPPMREAMVISRIRRVKTRPRLASVAAFLCLIVAHFECPDMTIPLLSREISRGCTDAVAATRSLSVPDARVPPQLSAEGYGEPQTRPANQTGQHEDLAEFSTGTKPAEPTRSRERYMLSE